MINYSNIRPVLLFKVLVSMLMMSWFCRAVRRFAVDCGLFKSLDVSFVYCTVANGFRSKRYAEFPQVTNLEKFVNESFVERSRILGIFSLAMTREKSSRVTLSNKK